MKIRKNKPKKRTTKVSTGGRTLPTNKYYRPQSSVPTSNSVQKTSSVKFKNVTISYLLNIIIAISIVILLIFATTLSTHPDINISKDSYEYHPKQDYELYAQELLRKSVFNQSKLLFRSTDFEEGMIEKFPEINQISAVLPLGGRDLTVTIVVSKPLALVTSGSNTGVMNDAGVLVTQNLTGSTSLPRIRFASPLDSFTLGSRLLTTSEVALIQLIDSELKSGTITGLKSPEIDEVLFNVSDGQLEVRIKDLPYFIKFSTYVDGREQVGAMITTIKLLSREGQTAPSQYIDVRVPGRAFVL